MKALVSGQAGLAVLIKENGATVISVENPRPVIVEPHQWPRLFADAVDVEEFTDISDEDALSALHQAWSKDRGLHLLLLLIDPHTTPISRVRAASYLKEFFRDRSVLDYVSNRMYSGPLPGWTDLVGAVDMASEQNAAILESFLEELQSGQAAIRRCRSAWDNLPVEVFGGTTEKERFGFEAVRKGVFRALSLDPHFTLDSQPGLNHDGLKLWIDQLRSSKTPTSIERLTRREDEESSLDESSGMLEIDRDHTLGQPGEPLAVEPRSQLEEESYLGSKWAVHLRRFLASYSPSELVTAVAQLQAETRAQTPPRLFSRLTSTPHYTALKSVYLVFSKLLDDDWQGAIRESPAAERRLRRSKRDADAVSISMIALNWQVRLGQSYLMAPAPLQPSLLSAGIEACTKCAELARSLRDTYSEAEYLMRLGNGLYSARRLVGAEEAFVRSLELWRRLAGGDFSYRAKVATGMRHLADLCSLQAQYGNALALYHQAIGISQGLPEAQFELASSLHNLGVLQLQLKEHALARAAIEQACSISERLLQTGVKQTTTDPYSPQLSFQLSRMRMTLGLSLAAQEYFDKAERIMEEAIRTQESYRSSIGTIAVFQVARSRSKLGQTLLREWLAHSESRREEPTKLRRAIGELSDAVTIFESAPGGSSSYFYEIAAASTALGIARGYDGNYAAADVCLKTAVRFADALNDPFERDAATKVRRAAHLAVKERGTSGTKEALAALALMEEYVVRSSLLAPSF